MNPPRQLARKN
ncbi:hypothetical protein BDFB_009907 [Asbolus verrucosus]|uniref:Uncharacterized protein n=1 Tax=Asbolus verrucosus TaxID=1661398 RepID=A0A482VBJ4_ASBVE|nr:hypothetical protein BDFB_009907 [Asbolus verrucosus]